MLKRLFIFPLLVLLLAACAAAQSGQSAAGEATGPVVTVYRSPT